MSRVKRLLPYLTFLVLLTWSLRDVLTALGVVGHTWDWSTPTFREQFLQGAFSSFFSWVDFVGSGNFSLLQNPLLPIWIIPWGIWGGELCSKVFPAFLLLLSATAMYQLAREVLRLNLLWATVAGLVYMLSPITYSRLIAGHLDSLTGYAILPLLTMWCLQISDNLANDLPISKRQVILAGLSLGLTALHQSILVLASSILPIVFFVQLVRGRRKISLAVVAIIFSIALLVNVSWMLPFLLNFVSRGSLGHGYSAGAQATIATEFFDRYALWQVTSRPVEQALRLFSTTGVRIEYINSLTGIAATGWMLVSFILAIAGLTLLLRRRISFPVLALLAIWLIGATFVSGAQTLFGVLTFETLKKFAPPVWAQFGNTTRAFPLVALALAALGPKALQTLFDQLATRMRQARRDARPITIIASAAAILIAGIWALPFLSGAITRPMWMSREPMALALYTVKPEDRAVYDFLRAAPAGARMTYVQPPWLGWNDKIDWGATWEIGQPPPLPKFLAPASNPRAWQAASDFSQWDGNASKGKLLALAAVKYVVYPYGLLFEDKRDFFPNQSGTGADVMEVSQRFASLKPIYDSTLTLQKALTPLPLNIPGTTIYENQAYLPRVYAAPTATLVVGSSDYLAPLANTPYFPRYPAFFFADQLPASSAARLAAQSPRVLSAVGAVPLAPSLGNSVRAIADKTVFISSPAKNATNSAGTFTVASAGTYNIRANVKPQSTPQNHLLIYASSEIVTDEIPAPTQWQVAIDQLTFIADYQWTSNTSYARRVSTPNVFQVRARLDTPDTEPFVAFARELALFDLRDYPTFHIVSQADDPKTQFVELWLGLDWDMDGKRDTVWTLPIVPETALKPAQIDLLSAARDAFPDQKEFRVVNAALRLTRRPKVNVKKVESTLYGFAFGRVAFQSRDAARAVAFLAPESIHATETPSGSPTLAERGIAATLPVSNHQNEITITHAFGSMNTRDVSGLTLAYRVDGPNTLVLDALLAPDAEQAARVPLGTRIIAPFSEGVLDFPIGGLPTAPRLELALTTLEPSTDLRATTFELARAQFYRRKTDSTPRPTAPTVKIDERVVSLSAMPATADRLGAWFSSSNFTLDAGAHTIAYGYADPKITDRVVLVEIAPDTLPPVPAPAPPTISFRQINPTRYAAHVENATAPFFLILSDSFHSDWRAYILTRRDAVAGTFLEQSALLAWVGRGGARTEIAQHDMVNGFANAWYVDHAGSFDVEIEFLPQRLYEGGIIVSLLTLIGCVAALLFVRRKSAGERR